MVAFFKVVQQQTIGIVEIQSSVCGQIISVCNSERITRIEQYLRKLCSNETHNVSCAKDLLFTSSQVKHVTDKQAEKKSQ